MSVAWICSARALVAAAIATSKVVMTPSFFIGYLLLRLDGGTAARLPVGMPVPDGVEQVNSRRAGVILAKSDRGSRLERRGPGELLRRRRADVRSRDQQVPGTLLRAST